MGRSEGENVGVVAVRSDRQLTRETEIVARYLNGETMQEIGGCYGVSRERIRQLLKRHNMIGLRDKPATRSVKCVPFNANDPRWRYAWSSAGVRWWRAHHKGKAVRRAHVAAIRAYVAETGDTKPSGPTVHRLTGTRSDVMLASWWGRPAGPTAPYTKYLNRLRKLAGITARDAGWRGHLKRTEEVS